MTRRLVAWCSLVAAMIALAYAARATEGDPAEDALYRYETFVGALIQYGIVLGLVLAIASGRFDLLALRRPKRALRGAGVAVAVIVVTYVVAGVVSIWEDAGDEQGIVPDVWDPDRSVQFALNFAAVTLVAPVVEELTFRGLGYSLFERFGRVFAIAATGIAFGLVHGLVFGLPILAVFGAGLAFLRERTDSVWPPIVLHALFNATALTVSVAT